jgi:hypothetical protein
MVVTHWDHGFVAIVFVVVFPFIGLWSYRRFLKRAAVEGEPALIREYRQTIFFWLLDWCSRRLRSGWGSEGSSAPYSPPTISTSTPVSPMGWP